MPFCEVSECNGVYHLKLTGGDDHHYLTKEGLGELSDELAKIRKLATSGSCKGLITTTSEGSFCDGIDLESLRACTAAPFDEQTKVLSDGMARVMKELLDMPMLTVCAATGNAGSLGFALALAHDDLVVLGDASYWIGMVEDGVVIHPHIGAIIREKMDRWYMLTTLRSRSRSGNWMKSWYFADAVAGSKDDVLHEAEKLVDEWHCCNGEVDPQTKGLVHADTRKKLFSETWELVAKTH